MSNAIYEILNIFFFAFHTAFTLFNMLGWLFRKTRWLHLITILLTAFSWGVLGYWYGWGYCFCTDWHWQVRRTLGYDISSDSYIHFLILKITGLNLNITRVNDITLIVFIFCFAASIWVNVKRNKKTA